MIATEEPGIAFIDSIQTITRESLPNGAGNCYSTKRMLTGLTRNGKENKHPDILIGHITKKEV